MIVNGKHYTSIWRNKKKQVFIIDQRILPHEFKIVELKNNSVVDGLEESPLPG